MQQGATFLRQICTCVVHARTCMGDAYWNIHALQGYAGPEGDAAVHGEWGAVKRSVLAFSRRADLLSSISTPSIQALVQTDLAYIDRKVSFRHVARDGEVCRAHAVSGLHYFPAMARSRSSYMCGQVKNARDRLSRVGGSSQLDQGNGPPSFQDVTRLLMAVQLAGPDRTAGKFYMITFVLFPDELCL